MNISKSIRTVIIGMGRMGHTRYQAMKKHGGFEITGVCDINEGNTQSCDCKKYNDWKICIDTEHPDAVFVCTYNVAIPDIVCYAIEKRMAVFSEKPPGRNLQDAKRMFDAYHSTEGAILKFGFNHRYHNSVIEARALIDSGILGDVVCARGVYGKAGSMSFRNEWRNNTEISGGGIMLDQGIHMLDLMYYFMGKFTSVESAVDQLVWKDMPTEDSAFSILRTADGKVASLHSSAIQWRHKFSLDIVCTEGVASLNGLITSTNSYGEERISYYRKDLELKTGDLGKPMEHTMCFDTDNSWDLEVAEFYDAVANGVPITQGTPDDAVNLMQMMEMIYK